MTAEDTRDCREADSKTPKGSARHLPGKMAAQGNRQGSNSYGEDSTERGIRQQGADEHAGASSAETIKLVPSRINPVDTNIPVRGNLPISVGGIAFLDQSTEELKRLEMELDRTELTKDLVAPKARKRISEIILFGVQSI